MNYLTSRAARSSFAYYAGNEVLQMTENTGDDRRQQPIDDFYDAMRKHYPYTDKLIDSFIAHTKADQKLGHEDAFLQMCKSVPPLTPREVNDALNVARSWPSTCCCSWTASTASTRASRPFRACPATCSPSKRLSVRE